MAKRKAVRKLKKTGKKAESVGHFVKKEHHAAIRKFHKLVGAWGEHVREEMALHKKMLGRRHHDLKKHVGETVAIHKKFLKKLERL